MKLLVATLLALAAVGRSRNIDLEDVIELEKSTKYSYVEIPEEEADNLDASRIYGGALAAVGSFPYTAGLLMVNARGGQALGTGVMLSSTKVLTAAHNWLSGSEQQVKVTVGLGSNVFNGGTRVESTNVVMHQNYNYRPLRNDIAMITLPRAVGYSNAIRPVSLPSGSDLNQNFAGQTATAIGFGQQGPGAPVPMTQPLKYVNLRVISNADCQRTYQDGSVQASVICTDGSSGNICTGDSGGPLVIQRGNNHILIGITSFGQGACGKKTPAGYARVTYYNSWIRSHM